MRGVTSWLDVTYSVRSLVAVVIENLQDCTTILYCCQLVVQRVFRRKRKERKELEARDEQEACKQRTQKGAWHEGHTHDTARLQRANDHQKAHVEKATTKNKEGK